MVYKYKQSTPMKRTVKIYKELTLKGDRMKN